MEQLWRTFRDLPTWLQTLGWVLAWPVLAAVWLWLRPDYTALARTAAVVLVVLMLPVWWLVPFTTGGTSGDRAAVGGQLDPGPPQPPTATPTPSPTAAPSPTLTPSPSLPRGVPGAVQPATVARIVDGDTIWVQVHEPGGRLAPGAEHKIRLLEYDAPEATSTTECGGPEATRALRGLIPAGAPVYLEADREDTDRYGRFLRYVYTADGTLVNLAMVRLGWGEAVLYAPNDAHIQRLRRAEREARRANRGVWGPPCDRDAPQPEPEPPPQPQPEPEPQPDRNCDPNYTGACIAPYPPDLDCGEVAAEDFRSVGSDPHGFDGDDDGLACES